MNTIKSEKLKMKKWLEIWGLGFGLFLFGILSSYSQDSLLKTPIITERELLHYSSYDLRTKDILAISPQRQMITYEFANGKYSYYFSDIQNDLNRKLVIRTTDKQRVEDLRFSQDYNLITFSLHTTIKEVTGGSWGNLPMPEITREFVIYDTRFLSLEKFDDIPYGFISPASKYILFQVKEDKNPVVVKRKEFARGNASLPSVYIALPNGKGERFITDGTIGEWSRDGKYFYVMKPKLYAEFERERTFEKRKINVSVNYNQKPSSFDVVQTIWIYSSLGDPLYELKNFFSPTFILWSPSYDEIIIRGFGEYDFHIVEIIDDANGLNVEEIGKFGAEENTVEETHNPVFSYDGKKILFVKSNWNLDNSHCLKNETWITNANGSKSFKLSETDDRTTEYPLWTKDGTILLLREKLSLGDEVELYVVEQTIQNLDEILK